MQSILLVAAAALTPYTASIELENCTFNPNSLWCQHMQTDDTGDTDTQEEPVSSPGLPEPVDDTVSQYCCKVHELSNYRGQSREWCFEQDSLLKYTVALADYGWDYEISSFKCAAYM